VRRRGFLSLLGGAAVWPLARRAESAPLPTIGFLGANTESAQREWTAAFVQRLNELGWVEGRTVAIEYRWAEGQFERSPGLIADLVRLNVDVIVTHGTTNIVAAKRATSTIPIVFALAGDPVANQLVSSLSRPGGNITGLSMQQPELAGKRLAIMREIVPNFRRLAMLVDVENAQVAVEMTELRTAARGLDLDMQLVEIRRADAIVGAIEALKGRADVLYVPTVPTFHTARSRIAAAAIDARLATIHSAAESVTAGGLVAYGPDFGDLFRRSAEYVDRILRGAKPATLPVEQPTKFDLAINLKTAKALGLVIPLALLALADQVIE
jgi:putative ABC transport system substrate-binding protein